MRFRIQTMMIAVAIVGLVTALVVLWWRARDEIRRAYVQMAVAEDRAILADKRAIAAEVRAQSAELQAKEALQRLSHVDDDRDRSQKSPTRRPTAAQ
jgi:hypothetical protein